MEDSEAIQAITKCIANDREEEFEASCVQG